MKQQRLQPIPAGLRDLRSFALQAQEPTTGPISQQTASLRRWRRDLAVRLEVGSAWDSGSRRKASPNEDSLVALQGTCIYNERLHPFGLFVVADGMGGHAYGKDASFLAIQAIVQAVLAGITGSEGMSEELLPEVLIDAVRQANRVVYRRGIEVAAYMGTTITAALVLDTTAYIVNVGDSRTYLYRESEGLLQITRDHSVVARLVESGAIEPDEIYTHPDRNQVYRGLGTGAQVEVDWFKQRLQVDDRLLLCSDGLWEMVRDPHIGDILRQLQRSPGEMCERLVAAAIKGGGLDNISAIVVHVAPVLG